MTRDLAAIDQTVFSNRLAETLRQHNPSSIDSFNNLLRDVLDEFAPILKKTVSCRPHVPWYTPAVQAAKQEKRKAERMWKKTGLTVHKNIYKSKRDDLCKIVENEKREHFNQKISSSGSSKELFKTCNELLGKSKAEILPTNIMADEVSNKFNSFFIDKVKGIRDQLSVNNTQPEYGPFKGVAEFNIFERVNQEDLKKDHNIFI